MREKLKSSRGETLVEVLASILICTLSIALLVGAVMASSRMDLQAREADEEYYDALTKAERQDKAPDGTPDSFTPDPALTVTVRNITSSTDPLTTSFYGTDRLFSYAAGTGGGP